MTVLEFFLLGIIAFMGAMTLYFQWKTGVPPMPSGRRERLEAIALSADRDISNNGIIYDLGSGWGGLVIALAKAYPNHQICGIELSWLPYWVSRWRCRRYHNIDLIRADFLQYDLDSATAVFCYLMIGPMPQLEAHLDRQLPVDTPVVTLAFWFRDRHPAKTSSYGYPGVALYLWNSANQN